MDTPMIEAVSSAFVMGISPWVLPLIAAVAKQKEQDARKTDLRRILRLWPRRKGNARRNDRVRGQVVMHERLRAKLEATIWPD